VLDSNTPTYGNRNKFICEKKSNISKGDIANDSFINTTVHVGTHIDMPYHFFEDGQTIEDFNASFFHFNNVLFIEVNQEENIIKESLVKQLNYIKNKNKYDILIVKTGACYKRDKQEFWKNSHGFHPSIADYLRRNFPNIRVFGFDCISVSSLSNRVLGREAHKEFLHPHQPILLLEDMNISHMDTNINFVKLIIAPFRIAKCDGLPCTVIAEINE